MVHNEALLVLETLVGGAVEEPPRSSPPTARQTGACYIIGQNPTGDWVGKAGQIAAWTPGGWRFIVPADGINLWVRSTGVTAGYRSGVWEIGPVRASSVMVAGQQVVGTQQPAIAAPSGGTTIDGEARASISAILSALRQHGLIAT